MGSAAQGTDGMKMFDINMPLNTTKAKAFFDKGFRAVGRYIPRLTAHEGDLTKDEITKIHLGGLAILPTQHVEPGEWTPTDDKGRQYGHTALTYCQQLGVPMGVCVVLDLESVAKGTPVDQVVRYCNYWRDVVGYGGYTPMIYLGWQVILSNAEAYKRLRFEKYWGAYNVDVVPAPRGYCIQQHAAKDGDVLPGMARTDIDTDLVKKDSLGGLPIFYAPDEWAV